jgi:glycosyltransferase involved in cell wall biosynthesis
MSNPLFSIIIPTRNRRRTLEFCLRTCLGQIDPPKYEVVICDNSDGVDTQQYVKALVASDVRAASLINYYFRSTVTSMTDNFERALSYARGQYVIVLGDDDGLLPQALFELERLIADAGAKAIKWSNGLYTWPELPLQDSANYLGFSLTQTVTKKNGHRELAYSLENLVYTNLPMLYINSAIHVDLIEKLRLKKDRVFSSRSPDVYSGFSIAYHCGDFIEVSAPLSLAGLSGASNGVSSAFSGTNAAPKKDYDDLNSKIGFSPHPYVPDLPIYPLTSFAESFYFAKADHFQNDDRFCLSRRRVLAECVRRSEVSDPEVRRIIRAACSDDPSLAAYVEELVAEERTPIPNPRLKPANLGADGVNLHLDCSDFGVLTIEDAAQLASKFIWPGQRPLSFN